MPPIRKPWWVRGGYGAAVAAVLGVNACFFVEAKPLLWLGFLLAVLSAAIALAERIRRPKESGHGIFRVLLIGSIPVLFMIFMTTRPQIRETTEWHVTTSNAKQLALAVHGFHDKHLWMPAAVTADREGRHILSWRVQLLPYIECAATFQKFKQDEAWDSPSNLPHVNEMPYVYNTQPFEANATNTAWQVFVGPGTAFDPTTLRLTLKDGFPDGTSNTLMFAESATRVPWSKPQDMAYDPDGPLPILGQTRVHVRYDPFRKTIETKGFFAALVDGSVRFVSGNVSDEMLRRVIVRNDGKPVADFWDR